MLPDSIRTCKKIKSVLPHEHVLLFDRRQVVVAGDGGQQDVFGGRRVLVRRRFRLPARHPAHGAVLAKNLLSVVADQVRIAAVKT